MELSGIEKKNTKSLPASSASSALSLAMSAGQKAGGELQTEKIISQAISKKDAAYYAEAAEYVKKNSSLVSSSLKRSFELYDEVVYAIQPKTNSELVNIGKELEANLLRDELNCELERLETEGKTAGAAEYDVAAGLNHHVRSVMAGPFTALQTLIYNNMGESAKLKQINNIRDKAMGILKLCNMLEKIDSESVKELLETSNHFSGVKSEPPARVPLEPGKMPAEIQVNFIQTVTQNSYAPSASEILSSLLSGAQEQDSGHREQALKFLGTFQADFAPKLAEMADALSKIIEAAREGKGAEDVLDLSSQLAKVRYKILTALPSHIEINESVLSKNGALDAAAGLGHILGQSAALTGLQNTLLTPPAEREPMLAQLDGVVLRLKSISAMLDTLENSPDNARYSPDNARYFLMTEIMREPSIQNAFLTPQN